MKLLMDSFGGKSFVFMIVCIFLVFLVIDEIFSILYYVICVNNIVNVLVVNLDVCDKVNSFMLILNYI